MATTVSLNIDLWRFDIVVLENRALQITARKRSLGQDNFSHLSVIHSVHRGGGSVQGTMKGRFP